MQICVYALAMHKHRFAQKAEPVVARLARQSPISLASKTKGLPTMPTMKLSLWSLYQTLWGWGFVVFFSWTSFPNSAKPQHWKKWTQEVMRLASLFVFFTKYYPDSLFFSSISHVYNQGHAVNNNTVAWMLLHSVVWAGVSEMAFFLNIFRCFWCLMLILPLFFSAFSL